MASLEEQSEAKRGLKGGRETAFEEQHILGGGCLAIVYAQREMPVAAVAACGGFDAPSILIRTD